MNGAKPDLIDGLEIVDMPWINPRTIMLTPSVGAGNGQAEEDSRPTDHRDDKEHRGSSSGRAFEKHDGKPYRPIHAKLLREGYRVARTFTYALPDGNELYCEDRYELRDGSKTSRYRYSEGDRKFSGTGPRRIIYNWPAIMAAGPGANVFITEGANKSEPLNKAGLLATRCLIINGNRSVSPRWLAGT